MEETQKKISREERIHEIKNKIRNVGISRLPTYQELGNMYGVSKTQISFDLNKIITELDPRELDEVFTDFYQSDLRALEVLKLIMHTGNSNDKIKAVNALINLQKGATELLEAFSKKQKVADKVAIASVNYNFTMNKPEEKVNIKSTNTEEEEEEEEE